MGQKSGCGLAGFSKIFREPAGKLLVELSVTWRLNRRGDRFPGWLTWRVGRALFSHHTGLFRWLFHNLVAGFPQDKASEQKGTPKTEVKVFLELNLRTEWHPVTFAIFCSLEASYESSQSLARQGLNTQVKEIVQGCEYQEAGILKGRGRGCLPQQRGWILQFSVADDLIKPL